MSKPVVREEVVVNTPIIGMTVNEFILNMCTGAIVGVSTAMIYVVLFRYVFSTVLCRPQSSIDCSLASGYAGAITVVIAVIIGVAVLVKVRTYRPLLVVLATVITLWGVQSMLSGSSWLGVFLVGGLFGVSFGLFSWLARLKNFILSIIVIVVAVMLLRFLMIR